jgi:hypothetical protein
MDSPDYSWITGKPEVSGDCVLTGLQSAPGIGEIDESQASGTAEIGADAWANIGAGHRMVTKPGPLCEVKSLKIDIDFHLHQPRGQRSSEGVKNRRYAVAPGLGPGQLLSPISGILA